MILTHARTHTHSLSLVLCLLLFSFGFIIDRRTHKLNCNGNLTLPCFCRSRGVEISYLFFQTQELKRRFRSIYLVKNVATLHWRVIKLTEKKSKRELQMYTITMGISRDRPNQAISEYSTISPFHNFQSLLETHIHKMITCWHTQVFQRIISQVFRLVVQRIQSLNLVNWQNYPTKATQMCVSIKCPLCPATCVALRNRCCVI